MSYNNTQYYWYVHECMYEYLVQFLEELGVGVLHVFQLLRGLSFGIGHVWSIVVGPLAGRERGEKLVFWPWCV